MDDFKDGDKVIYNSTNDVFQYRQLEFGTIYTITRTESPRHVTLDGFATWFSSEFFIPLAENRNRVITEILNS